MEVNRRSQSDRTAATRAALVTAARRLFAADGYAAVGTTAIAREAGVTRGALYHQFADKAALFAAVFEAVEQDVGVRVDAIVAGSELAGPLDAMQVGARAWLEVAGDPEVQRIALVDGPVVLGWDRWREIGMRYAMGLIEAVVGGAIEAGALPEQPVRPLSLVLLGALDEAALYVAGAEDQDAAREEMGRVLERMIAGLGV